MSTPLPPGWTAQQDPHGRWYFHNAATNTTQWHAPAPAPAYSYAAPPPPHAPYGAPYSGHYPAQQHPPHPATRPAQPTPQGYPAAGAPTGYPSSAVPPGGRPTGGGGAFAGKPAAAAGAAVAGAGGKYVYNQPMQYKLKEKIFSLSGDSFQVTDAASGATAFKIKGNALSFKDSKKLLDPSGRALYAMSESILSLRGRMSIVEAGSKQPVVTLRKKGVIPLLGTGTVQVWRGGSENGAPWVSVKGNILRKDFSFTENATGRVVASVKRKGFNLNNLVFEKDTYVIRVEPGVDAALMVFLVVALDEQYRDDGNSAGLF